MSRYKTEIEQTTALSAIETMYSMAEELGGEFRELCDNTPDSLQGGDLYSVRDETASTLEGLQDPGAPDECPDPKIGVGVQMRGGKKRGSESRAVRWSNAAAYGRAGAEALRAEADRLEEEGVAEDLEEGDRDEAEQDLETFVTELREYADEVEGHADEIEGCEFPGMYG